MIFTFYSFKGGVGRSLTLAGVAQVLARRGLKVLAVDFDLEAPGLERYFYSDDESRARRTELGLMDLIRKYREALTDEAAFERAEFKRLQDFVFEAVSDAGSRGGSVHLLSAGKREPAEALQEYALAVRNFDWQDFFYNWKGGRFFEWLCRQWKDPATGYDVVLVDSRTGVTEMGGVSAYQLADVVVLLCAPNYQNLEGTRDVARDFVSDSVKALRHGRPLQIVALPARLDPKHPKRQEFLAAFSRELDAIGLPKALADAGQTYETLALPYLPELSVGELLVSELSRESSSMDASFERLADALTLLAPVSGRLGEQQSEALARLAGESVEEAAPLEADTTKGSSGYDAFIDSGAADRDWAAQLSRALTDRGLSVFGTYDQTASPDWSPQVERALRYSAHLLVCFGASGGSEWRDQLLRSARRNAALTILPVLLPGCDERALRSFGLEESTAFDLRSGLIGPRVDELLEVLKRPGHTQALDTTADRRNPFPGARAFAEDDSRFFYGRDDAIHSLASALLAHRIVVLEGPAKVGKTSLVQGGLIPKLRSGKAAPVRRIVYVDAATGLTLPRWRRDVAPRRRTIDVVVIDSVDSFATFLSPAEKAERLRRIDDFVRRAPLSFRILIVWRGSLPREEYGQALDTWSRGSSATLKLEPLRDASLRDAIEAPARAAGQLLENGLLQRLVESSGSARSAIFQIQVVLAELWSTRRRGWLTNKSLDSIGHLGGFFQNHIHTHLARLGESDRAAATDLFIALTDVTEAGEWLPQPLPWSDVETIPSVAAAGGERLRDLLAAGGLIDLWREEAAPLAVGSATGPHVALVRPNARQYFTAEEVPAHEPFMRWRSRLNAAARQWKASAENTAALLPLEAVAEAKNWLDTRHDALIERERSFIQASVDARWVAFEVAGRRTDSPGEAVAGDVSWPAAAVTDSVTVSATPESSVQLSVVPGQDVIVLNPEDGPSVILHPEAVRDIVNLQRHADAAADTPEYGRDAAAHASAAPVPKGGSLFTSALRSLQVMSARDSDPAAELSASTIVRRLDSQTSPGLYPLRPESWPAAGQPAFAHVPASRSDAPTLVLIHGMLLDGRTTFNALWNEHPDLVQALFAHYGDRVFALEYPTLSTSPIESARMLAESWPAGTRLHLLGHSTGGLVAEVIARAAARRGVNPPDVRIFSGPGNEMDRRSLSALSAVMTTKGITVDRVVRVGCPIRGSTFLSKRLDAYLSMFTWALQSAGVSPSADLKLLTFEVARRRSDPSALPGLQALLPDSALIRWIHAGEALIPGDLRVVAGKAQEDRWSNWLGLLSDGFHWSENDLLVATRSMFGGVLRFGGNSFLLHEGADAHHFRYFTNHRTAQAVVEALVSDNPAGFQSIGPLSWAGQSSTGIR